MSNPSKNATFKAIIDTVITELMFKTTGDQVYLNETTTVSAKIAEMIAAINLRAKTNDVNKLIADLAAEVEKKATSDNVSADISELRKTHTNDTAAFNTKFDALVAEVKLRAKTTEVTAMIDALRQEMLGDVPVEAYDTFAELAEYIEEHQEASDALTAAIGTKADQTVVNNLNAIVEGHTAKIAELERTVGNHASSLNALNDEISKKANTSSLGSLAGKSKVAESDLSTELKAKVNAASEGNHSHSNKGVLDNISSENVASWNGKTSIHIGSTQPSTSETNYIWFHVTE